MPGVAAFESEVGEACELLPARKTRPVLVIVYEVEVREIAKARVEAQAGRRVQAVVPVIDNQPAQSLACMWISEEFEVHYAGKVEGAYSEIFDAGANGEDVIDLTPPEVSEESQVLDMMRIVFHRMSSVGQSGKKGLEFVRARVKIMIDVDGRD